MKIHFKVASSSGPDLYDVVAEASAQRLSMRCNCVAGSLAQTCKHRLSLLAGDVTAVVTVVNGRAEDLAAFRGDTPIGRRLAEIAALEAEQEAIKRRIKAAKKALGRELEGVELA